MNCTVNCLVLCVGYSGSTQESAKPVKILCWILTDPADLNKRTAYVRDTWTKHCDIRLFMSSALDSQFPAVGLNVSAGRDHIAAKAKAAWKYVHTHYIDQADYFVKADPDTYVVIDNLRRYMASRRGPHVPEFFGHRFYLRPVNVTYVSGGSGLVLSQECLRRLMTAFNATPDCLPDGQGKVSQVVSDGGRVYLLWIII